MTHTDDLEQLDFLLAAQYAIECAFMPCVVCATETPHRLLGTMDGVLAIYRCGACGTTHSRLKGNNMKPDYYHTIAQQRGDAYARAVALDDAEKFRRPVLADDPAPMPEPPDPEPDEDDQYRILWP